MIKSLLVVLTVFVSSFAFAGAAESAAAYEKAGKELLASINTGKVDVAAAQKLVDTMTEAAMSLFADFVKKHPESDKLHKFIQKNLGEIKKASFESLEKDYHDGNKLTKALVGVDLKSEDGEKYTDPLHTLIHPIMTLKAIEKKDLKSAKEELNEGLEQVKNTAKLSQ